MMSIHVWTLDGIPGLVPDLVPGIQGWKKPWIPGTDLGQGQISQIYSNRLKFFTVTRPSSTCHTRCFPQSFGRIFEERKKSFSPGAEGEFGWHTTWSITVGHSACHRWPRWWERRGTGSLSSNVDRCYSNLFDLLRVKTRVCSYNLYATPFLRALSFPSQLTLVKLIKLKRT